MPCITDISPSDEANHFQVLLCQACKYLSPKQIDSLKNPGSGFYDRLSWYSSHLADDYMRRCHNNDVIHFSFETTEAEKSLILKELNRIGFDLIEANGVIVIIHMKEKK